MQLPLARQTGLIIKEIPGELLIYDSDRERALCLNRAAASVWKHCDGKTTPARMARVIEQELQIEEGEDIVALALEKLQESHLLIGKAAEGRGLSRRELMGRIGIAAAVPIISLVLVPTAKAGTASCTPNEGSCTLNGDCCSGCCSNATCVPTGVCFKQ
jgi:hypothetical protein